MFKNYLRKSHSQFSLSLLIHQNYFFRCGRTVSSRSRD